MEGVEGVEGVVLKVGDRGHVLGIVVVAQVGLIKSAFPWFQKGAQAVGVAVWRRGLWLRLRLGPAGRHRGHLGGCGVERGATRFIGSFSDLHLIEIDGQARTLRLLKVHPLLVQSVRTNTAE